MNQKGFVPLIIILIVAAIASIYFISTNSSKTTPPLTPPVYPSPSPSIQEPGITTLNKTCTGEKALCDLLNKMLNDINSGNAKNLVDYQIIETTPCPNNQCPTEKEQTGYISGKYQSEWAVSENKLDYQNTLTNLFKPIPDFQGFSIKQGRAVVVYTRPPADKFSNPSFVVIGVKKYPEGYKIGAILYGVNRSGIALKEGEFQNEILQSMEYELNN